MIFIYEHWQLFSGEEPRQRRTLGTPEDPEPGGEISAGNSGKVDELQL